MIIYNIIYTIYKEDTAISYGYEGTDAYGGLAEVKTMAIKYNADSIEIDRKVSGQETEFIEIIGE